MTARHGEAPTLESVAARAGVSRATAGRVLAGSPRVSDHARDAVLRAAAELCRRDPAARVTVFTTIERFFDEPDGSLTVLLRSGGPEQALRAPIAAAERSTLEPRLRATTAEFRQNYLHVAGRLERGARGFVLVGTTAGDWSVAAPEFSAITPR